MTDLSLQEMLPLLPPELQTEVRDFAAFLLERTVAKKHSPMTFEWAGVLKELGGQFTSVQVQHQISDWRSG